MKTKLAEFKNEWQYHALLLLAVFLMLWPIIFMLSTSLKTLDQVFEATLNPLPFPPTFDNYLMVLEDFPLFTISGIPSSLPLLLLSAKRQPALWQLLPLCTTNLNAKKLS